jgi:CheY-like chemotaxis protein
MEVLISSPEIERRIAANEAPERIADGAREAGMRGLWESGVQHVRNGITSVEELLRVIEAPIEQAAAPARSSAAIQADILPPPEKGRVQTLHSKPPSIFSGESFQLVDEENANANGQSKKVLLVEDEDALRRVLKDLLEREGFTVFEAADGVKALDEIDRANPDIVVLDLNLPRLDGYGVLSHLRARPATVELPVIVLTAKGDEDSEVRVFEYGASDYLTKPFRPRALSARLHSLLTRAKE